MGKRVLGDTALTIPIAAWETSQVALSKQDCAQSLSARVALAFLEGFATARSDTISSGCVKRGQTPMATVSNAHWRQIMPLNFELLACPNIEENHRPGRSAVNAGGHSAYPSQPITPSEVLSNSELSRSPPPGQSNPKS